MIRSKITYCSPVWRPCLIKDILLLERVQRRATKYILCDFNSDYKSRLISLHLLPLMYTYELADILLLVKSLQYPDPSFPVMKYIAFSSSNTRSGSFMKLTHQSSNLSTAHHTYFKRIVRLWNVLPPIDIKLSLFTIKNQIKSYMWEHFLENFVPSLPCSFHVKCPCNKCIYLYRTPTF